MAVTAHSRGLCDILIRNWLFWTVGTIIPPIPEKRWTGNMDATFVEERRQALEHFIVSGISV